MCRIIIRVALSVVTVVLAAGCADKASVPEQARGAVGGVASTAEFAGKVAPMASDMAGASVRMATQSVPATVAPPSPGPMSSNIAQGSTVPSMIIRNGSASVQVDSLELGIAAVQRMATTYGGFVGNTSLSAGDNQVRSATIELKIPSARYDEALAGLKPIGKVEAITSTAEDVGEEFVDMTARVTNARRLEERLITLLATRTGKLEDVLAVERELARVREEIERYEGRLRFLKTRVAISTLSVTVHERMPLVSAAPGENVLLEAVKDAWRNFVHFLAALIASMGVIIPTVALLAAGLIGWRRWRRRST